jgi:hypothetical protein
MANIVACQTLGEMSTPSKAGAEQRGTQHATWLTHNLGFRYIATEITRHKSIVI